MEKFSMGEDVKWGSNFTTDCSWEHEEISKLWSSKLTIVIKFLLC